jgi:polar amino acid transport system substrate-binding protein
MKKTIFGMIILLIGFSILFFGCEKKSEVQTDSTALSDSITLRPGILSVGMEIGYPPMEYLADDGITPIGFDVSMALALGEKLGMEVDFIDTAWEGIFAGVDTDKYDCVISSVTITDERLLVHNFSIPYIENTLAIVIRKDSKFNNIQSPHDLAGLNVAYQGDTTSDHYMQNLTAETGMQFIPRSYDKVMNCFDDLANGRVDVIITDLLVAYEYLSRANDLEIVWQGGDEQFGICMKKGNDALTQAIDEALNELFDEGTMLQISYDIFDMDLISAVRN